MDLEFMLKQISVYRDAAWLTIQIAFLGTLIALGIGLIGSIILYYRVPFIKGITKAYVEVARNTPLLIQLFFMYYGLTKVGLRLSSMSCAVFSLGFLGGAYMIEAFRGGLEGVGKSQIEAGLSVGLSPLQVMCYVILPQGIGIAVPGIGANCIFLLKETSVVSAIAIAELLFVTKDIIGMYYKTEEALLMLVITYLILIIPLSLGMRWVERRMRHGTHGC
ncbi:MAG: amino acid ABC transporter permease [Cellulosilyticaceae bacterium]